MSRSILGLVSSWLIAIALVAEVAPARAEAAAPEAGATALSLEDVLSLAKERAPEVSLARQAVREAEARRVGAGVRLPTNPRLSVDARPVLRGASASDVGYAATLDALFEVNGAPGARREEADRAVDVAATDLRVGRLDARARAFAAYVRARVAEMRMGEIAFAVELAERVLAASSERTNLGASGDIERTLAESELGTLRAAASAREEEHRRALMALRDALDLPAEAPIRLTTALDDPGAVAAPPALAAAAEQGLADLEAIRRRADLLAVTEERLAREAFPKVGGYLGVDSSPVSPTFGVVGLSVELPIAQRNQGPRARVAAQRATEMERLSLTARRVARDVYAAHAAYEARRRELKILTDEALPSAQRTLDLATTGWRSGRFDIFRVTSAARDLARVRALRLDALESAWLEKIALERAVGAEGKWTAR